VSAVDMQACYAIAPGHRMQWEETRQGWVILYPEGMVALNDSAAETLRCCDGRTPLHAVVADLQSRYADSELENDVCALIAAALQDGWLRRR